MAATHGTAAISDQVRARMNLIVDAHTRQMAAAWANAWDDVAVDLEASLLDLAVQAEAGKITRAAVLRSTRLQNALEAVESKLNDLFEQSGSLAINQLGSVVQVAGAMQERLIASQLPAGSSRRLAPWARVDPQQLEAIVTRSTEQITKTSFPLSSQATAAMKRELVRGLATGSNPRIVAGDMLKRAESSFNGGLSRAMTIARTELLDAQRAAAGIADQMNADFLAGWTWSASLSERTCPACWSMDGREFPLDVAGPLGHQNCRCARVPKTKSWKELGFDIDEPRSVRPDAESVFRQLDATQQLAVLGPTRYQAWQAGRYPMSAWAQRRSNPGWRSSYVPSKAPPSPAGRNPSPAIRGGGGSGGRKPPRPGAGPPKGQPPIGRVLDDGRGNRYHLPGAQVDAFNLHHGDHYHPYIPIPAHRTAAMLQYFFHTEQMVKAAARNINAGLDPWRGITSLGGWRNYWNTLGTDPALLGYTKADLKLDIIAAGTRLANMADRNLGTVYRGMAMDEDVATLLQRYSGGRVEDWSYSSTTKAADYARVHAEGYAQATGKKTVVVWQIIGAKGQILQSVGRMAEVDERLVSGQIRVLGSVVSPDGVVEVYARWLSS